MRGSSDSTRKGAGDTAENGPTVPAGAGSAAGKGASDAAGSGAEVCAGRAAGNEVGAVDVRTGWVHSSAAARHDTGPGHPERAARVLAIERRLVPIERRLVPIDRRFGRSFGETLSSRIPSAGFK